MSRFRADPSKVRVRVSFGAGEWMVCVEERGPGMSCTAIHEDPKEALNRALELAEDCSMDGIDLDMMWSYDHPMRPNE